MFSNENKENSYQIKIFCPESPKMPISRFNHTPMNAWFNVYDAYCSDNQGICNAATVNKIPVSSIDNDLSLGLKILNQMYLVVTISVCA